MSDPAGDGRTVKPEEYQTRSATLAGWPVRVTSYRLDSRFHATVENVDPGARIARGEGPTREVAERTAIDKATGRLGRTRIR